MKRIGAAAFAVFMALFSAGQAVAEPPEEVTLRATITPFSVLATIARLEKSPGAVLVMASPGGHLLEGIKLGEFIRDNDIKVIVPEGERCASACAFAAIASYDLTLDGDLWFHRPFLPLLDTRMSIEDAMNRHALITLQVVTYLKAMGVHDRLIEAIYSRSDRGKFIVVRASPAVIFSGRGALDVEEKA